VEGDRTRLNNSWEVTITASYTQNDYRDRAGAHRSLALTCVTVTVNVFCKASHCYSYSGNEHAKALLDLSVIHHSQRVLRFVARRIDRPVIYS
jgi:hypothetical protein